MLALIGLALGVSNRKDGKLGGFVLGIGVVFVYYILLYSRALARSAGRIPPSFGAVARQHRARRGRHRAGALARRLGRSADPHQLPTFRRRPGRRRRSAAAGAPTAAAPGAWSSSS